MRWREGERTMSDIVPQLWIASNEDISGPLPHKVSLRIGRSYRNCPKPKELRRAGDCIESICTRFDPVYGEVLFLDMRPANGRYEPLLGYIPLEQAQAAVDMLGLRLLHVKKSDLK